MVLVARPLEIIVESRSVTGGNSVLNYVHCRLVDLGILYSLINRPRLSALTWTRVDSLLVSVEFGGRNLSVFLVGLVRIFKRLVSRLVIDVLLTCFLELLLSLREAVAREFFQVEFFVALNFFVSRRLSVTLLSVDRWHLGKELVRSFFACIVAKVRFSGIRIVSILL